VEVCAPCPGACDSISILKSKGARQWEGRMGGYIPNTTTSATLYGNGNVKLKESSSGSTAGSPSIVIARSRKNAASNSQEDGEGGSKNDLS